MKTFKWTVPEPEHVDPGTMRAEEARAWASTRRRGVEWYVVSKGLVFLGLHPAASHGLMGVPLSPQLFLEGWLAGLALGGIVWGCRELRFMRAVDSGIFEDE